jgi:LysM repeat protein
MAAEVLNAGARSIFLDVEPHSGFWRGTTQDAIAFGNELRRLQPSGRVVLSIDPRPWTFNSFPIKEFAAFSDAIAPQNYWRTFNTPANHRRYQETGYQLPPEGVTPEFLLAASKKALAPLRKPLIQVGQGATPEKEEFKRFIDLSYVDGGDMVTVWRYGVTSEDVFKLLLAIPPRRPPPPAAPASRNLTAAGTYIVQSGDTLSGIAAAQGVAMGDLASINGISDPYIITVGQELKIPGAALTGGTSQRAGNASPGGGGGQVYVVQSGDTLGAIAGKFGTTAQAIADANGLSDVNSISIDQELKIP